MNDCIVQKLPYLEWIGQFSKITFCIINYLSTLTLKKSHYRTDRIMDNEALNQRAEQLLAQYGNGILRLAYSYLHNMNDAEDILQDTLVQYLKTAPMLKDESHEKAWLLRVASNLSKNKIKYNKMRDTDELNEQLIAEQREDLSFVWEAVKSLPPQYRETIHLFYYEGYSTSQISAILKLKETTVRSNLHRGRIRLKEILREVYDFDETI